MELYETCTCACVIESDGLDARMMSLLISTRRMTLREHFVCIAMCACTQVAELHSVSKDATTQELQPLEATLVLSGIKFQNV